MTNIPLVTIITVVYNDYYYIGKTIESVINQTYPSKEYIIIDGGSTDGTIDIIKNYEQSIDQWISERDNGIYDAMNKGIKLAQGEWINFMNSTDTFVDANVIARMVENRSNADIIYANVYYKYLQKQELYVPLALDKFWKSIPFCHQGTLVRSSLYKKHMFDLRYKISSVYDFFYKCYTSNNIFLYQDFVVCNYDMTGLSSHSFLWLWDYIRISMKYSKHKRILVFFRIFRLFFSRLKRLLFYR